MFDYLKINKNMLPISEEEKGLIGNPEWQTKSFDCLFHEIEITDDGRLRELKFDLVQSDTETESFSGLTSLVKTNQRWEYIGGDMEKFVVIFYDDTPNGWYEFNAYFYKGRLVEITGGKETPENKLPHA